jgi:hypothetical protein
MGGMRVEAEAGPLLHAPSPLVEEIVTRRSGNLIGRLFVMV